MKGGLTINIFCLVLLWGLIGPVNAHEQWLDSTNFFPKSGEQVRLYLGSGHHFPASSVLLKERVLHDLEIIQPNGSVVSLMPHAAGKRHEITHRFKEAGTYLTRFTLKQPQMKQPKFQAKAIIVVGEQDDQARYLLGQWLEIVPQTPLSSLKKGDTLTLAVFFNGTPVAAKLTIVPERGRVTILSSSPEKPAEFSPKRTGRYLASCSYEGMMSSLTFAVQGLASNEQD